MFTLFYAFLLFASSDILTSTCRLENRFTVCWSVLETLPLLVYSQTCHQICVFFMLADPNSLGEVCCCL